MLKRFKLKNLSMKNLLECCGEKRKIAHEYATSTANSSENSSSMMTGVEAPPMAHHHATASPYMLVATDARMEKSRTIFASTLLRIFRSYRKSNKEKLNLRQQKSADAAGCTKVRTFFFVLFLSVILSHFISYIYLRIKCPYFKCNCIGENLNFSRLYKYMK